MLAVLMVVRTRPAVAVDNEVTDSPPVQQVPARRGSCQAAGLCCQSKNNTCRGLIVDDEEDLGAVVEKKQIATSCFCDSACVDVGDCCDDYVQACRREFSVSRNMLQIMKTGAMITNS